MNKLIAKIRSEDGDSNIVEAIIVYPVVLLVVLFLVILGFTYIQEGFLNYKSQSLSDYFAKSVLYPGYTSIQKPEYWGNDETFTIGDFNKAMSMQAPYRYLFGLFSKDAGIKDPNGNDLDEKYVTFMAGKFLPAKSYLKTSGGSVYVPDGYGKATTSAGKIDNGYVCAIVASTSQIKVYLAQNYVFARFFTMIGLGNYKLVIHGEGNTAVCDSLEIMKTVDMSVDVAKFLAEKLGIDTKKFKTLKDLIKGDDK